MAPKMTAGSLTHQFQLQTPAGTSPEDFTDLATVWGSLAMKTGVEELREGVPSSVATVEIIIYYRDDVRAEMSLYEPLTDRRFQIQSYGDPDGRKRQLTVTCLEVL